MKCQFFCKYHRQVAKTLKSTSYTAVQVFTVGGRTCSSRSWQCKRMTSVFFIARYCQLVATSTQEQRRHVMTHDREDFCPVNDSSGRLRTITTLWIRMRRQRMHIRWMQIGTTNCPKGRQVSRFDRNYVTRRPIQIGRRPSFNEATCLQNLPNYTINPKNSLQWNQLPHQQSLIY
jgi:hypothetical protein